MDIFEELEAGCISESAAQTQQLAERLADLLPENQILKLSGSLGTGKTTFVQGLAKAWTISESVKSPTFNLYAIYQGTRQLIHLDAYRLTSPTQAEDLLIEEFLRPPFCLAIEWPEKIEGWMQTQAWYLEFSITDTQNHRIQLTDRPT